LTDYCQNKLELYSTVLFNKTRFFYTDRQTVVALRFPRAETIRKLNSVFYSSIIPLRIEKREREREREREKGRKKRKKGEKKNEERTRYSFRKIFLLLLSSYWQWQLLVLSSN